MLNAYSASDDSDDEVFLAYAFQTYMYVCVLYVS